MHIGLRIKQLMDAKKISGKEMAVYCGITPGAVSGWFSTGRISKEKLAKAAELLEVSTDDLISGDVITDSKAPPVINLENNPDYPAIRRAKFKLQAGADGYAIENDDTNGLPVVFRRDWFEMHNYKPERMLAIRVTGPSMEPSLFAGDLVIVNLAQDQPRDGHVFAVNYEGEMVIKRMVRDSGNWLLRSDNPDKARFSDKHCHEGCSVLGEIVYKQSERI